MMLIQIHSVLIKIIIQEHKSFVLVLFKKMANPNLQREVTSRRMMMMIVIAMMMIDDDDS